MFLANPDQKVLLLHGEWGTGKSFFWNDFVKRERQRIQEQFYSYVSLFGAASITGVKGLVVLSGSSTRDKGQIAAGWRRTKNWVIQKRRYFDELKVPYLGSIGAFLPRAEELLIQDFLVCFDDLERRSPGLDIDQFFGLVAVLKEQNKCRVVIVCNEEELSHRDRRLLEKYREKIVDRELTYNPPFNENFSIIFVNDDPAARDVFERLRLNNIRVFQQTRWCLQYFEPLLKNRHDAFVYKFRQQCAKLAAVHFAYSKLVDLEKVRSTSWMLAGWSERAAVDDPSSDLIARLQFTPSDADDFIVRYLRDGYCNLPELIPIIDRLNEQYKRAEADTALGRFWDRVWQTFAINAVQLTEEARNLRNEYHSHLPFKYTTELLDFVRKINPSFDPEPLRELAARSLIPNADVATLRTIQAACKDAEIQSAAKTTEQERKPQKTIDELVVALGATDGWDPANFTLLNGYSEDELFEWVSNTAQDDVLYAISETIARGQLESADSKSGPEVGRKFRRVFERIAQRSVLDAERTISVFDRIRRKMKQYGREASPEICPSLPQADQRSLAEADSLEQAAQ